MIFSGSFLRKSPIGIHDFLWWFWRENRVCKSIYTGCSLKRTTSGNASFALAVVSKNMFPLAVLELGPQISFHWGSLIKTTCKKIANTSIELFCTSNIYRVLKKHAHLHVLLYSANQIFDISQQDSD